MALQTKKLGDFKVPELKVGADDKRPIMGGDMIPHLYCSMFLAAKKNTGKTTTIAYLLDRCAGSHTNVVVFSSTILNDPKWAIIEAKHRKKGGGWIGYESLVDPETRVNLLKQWLAERTEEAARKKEEEIERKLEAARKKAGQTQPSRIWGGNAAILAEKKEEEEEPEDPNNGGVTKKRRPPRERMPEWFFVFDDFSDELRDKSLESFVKKHRHFKTKCIISSQALKDIPPGIRSNTDIWLFYRGLTDEHLKTVYALGTINVPFPKFLAVYRVVADDPERPHSFLYVDTSGKPEIRMNFSDRIEL